MRKVIIMFALAMGIATANAQENVTVGTDNGSEQPTLTKEVYPQKEADGDLYHGLTKKLTFDRMVPPHGLEVTYDKTVHVIFRHLILATEALQREMRMMILHPDLIPFLSYPHRCINMLYLLISSASDMVSTSKPELSGMVLAADM